MENGLTFLACMGVTGPCQQLETRAAIDRLTSDICWDFFCNYISTTNTDLKLKLGSCCHVLW